jgi:hypothetical protein
VVIVVEDTRFPEWVMPIDKRKSTECVSKSRVIYADEMVKQPYPGQPSSLCYILHGVSSSPELEDEWERWLALAPNWLDKKFRDDMQNWFRKMPRKEKP